MPDPTSLGNETDDEPTLRFRMVRDSVVTMSTSLTDLTAAVVGGGYASLPPTQEGDGQALLARWQCAAATANRVQAVFTSAAVEGGTFDVNTTGEEVLTPLFADRINPVEVVEWNEPVSLVLISTHYAPFTDRTPPTGHVRWINPHTERTFLESLASVGAIELEVGPIG